MLETLLVLLRWDLPCPEILLEDDDCLCLDYSDFNASVSIWPDGKLSWAVMDRGSGTDMEELRVILHGMQGAK